jgi:hypothetical protein
MSGQVADTKQKTKLKVGLIQVDGKWANPALMKLSAFHKKRGDETVLIDLSSLAVDLFYGSKIFMGGSGFDLKSELPEEIELQVPDYDLYKNSNGTSIGFTSRGCIRDCGFCIVKEKEGGIRETPFDWIQSPNVLLLDNNFLASPKWKEKLEYFIRQRLKVCFSQGLDIRLVNDENSDLLSQVNYRDNHFRKKRLYFAFDDPKLEQIIIKKVNLLKQHGIKAEEILFYVLVGYNTTFDEDMHRFKVLNDLGCLPFIMLYNNTRKPLLRKFARWVNKRYYKVVSWQDYDKNKGVGV